MHRRAEGVKGVREAGPAPRAEGGPYELTLVSPRNYFLFTPLLPSELACLSFAFWFLQSV